MFELPETDKFLGDARDYPVSGDAIAAHLDDPHPSHPTHRRFPFGDLLWSQPGVVAA